MPKKPVNVKVKAAGRRRAAAGWTLLLLGLLAAGVWVASGWCRGYLKVRQYALGAESGTVFLWHDSRYWEDPREHAFLAESFGGWRAWHNSEAFESQYVATRGWGVAELTQEDLDLMAHMRDVA